MSSIQRAASAPRSTLSRQGSRFVLVGVVNTAFGFGLFAALELLVGDRVPYLYLLVMAHFVSVFEAYIMQRFFVFEAQGHWWGDLIRFWSVYLSALAVNLVALPVLVETVGVAVLPAQALVLTLIVGATFIAHRRFTFRRPLVAPRPDDPGAA